MAQHGQVGPIGVVLDPNADIARLVGRALRLRGFRVLLAGDARRAASLIRRVRPAVLVCEAAALGGDLGAATPRTVAIVLMSGHGALLHRLEAEGRPCLRKPFALDDLYAAVDVAIGGR
jgi:DNA-binding response OmpR family regulator